MANPDNLIDYLVETSSQDRAARADGKSLRYVARMSSGKWLGPKNGVSYVQVDGQKVAVSSVHAGRAIPAGTTVNVRYANGKYVAFW